MLDKGMIHVLGGMELDIERCHHASQNGVKYGNYQLLTSRSPFNIFGLQLTVGK